MTFKTQTCLTLHCDGCGVLLESDDSGMIPHWDTEDEALKAAPEYGWLVAGRTVKCTRCIAKAECALLGHEMLGWDDQPAKWRDALEPDGSYVGKARMCRRCSGMGFDPPYPDHPHAIASGEPGDDRADGERHDKDE